MDYSNESKQNSDKDEEVELDEKMKEWRKWEIELLHKFRDDGVPLNTYKEYLKLHVGITAFAKDYGPDFNIGEKTREIYKYIQKAVENDETIDPDFLSEEQKKGGLISSYNLIKHLFPSATADLLPIEIEDITTWEIIQSINEWMEDNGGDILHNLKRFNVHEDTAEYYSMELFEAYSVIASIGYGVKILTDKYGKKWQNSIGLLKSEMDIFKKWGALSPPIIDKTYRFSTTYKPRELNKYIIKKLLEMGISRRSILKLPIPQNAKATAKDYNGVTLPDLPITIKHTLRSKKPPV